MLVTSYDVLDVNSFLKPANKPGLTFTTLKVWSNWDDILLALPQYLKWTRKASVSLSGFLSNPCYLCWINLCQGKAWWKIKTAQSHGMSPTVLFACSSLRIFGRYSKSKLLPLHMNSGFLLWNSKLSLSAFCLSDYAQGSTKVWQQRMEGFFYR